jgi:hypothetical protein
VQRMAQAPDLVPPPALARLAPAWTATLAYRLGPDVTIWRVTHSDFRRVGALRQGHCARSGSHRLYRLLYDLVS